MRQVRDFERRGECPELEQLASWVDGRLDPEARAAVTAHLSSCERCYDTVLEVSRNVADVKALHDAPTGWTRRWTVLAAAATVVLAVGAVVVWLMVGQAAPRQRPELGELAASLNREPARSSPARFVGPFDYRPPPSLTRSGALHEASPDVRIAAARLEKAAASGSAQDLAALGVASVATGKLNEGVEILERVIRENADNAIYMNDAAAAYLSRALWMDRAEDWPRALTLSERALRLDPDLKEAYFNRALALEGLKLFDEAERAWLEFRDREQGTEWASEADSRLEALRQLKNSGHRREDDLQPLRERIEDEILPAWGRAWLAGKLDEANDSLLRARALARELVERGGDGMPHDGVLAIDESIRRQNSRATKSLARAHIRYGDARIHLLNERVTDAAQAMTEATSDFGTGRSPYVSWGPIFSAIARRVEGRADEAVGLLQALPPERFEPTYRHLRGRRLWTEGIALEILGRMDTARDRLSRAQSEFMSASELENLTATQAHAAEVQWLLGQRSAAWRLELSALGALASLPVSTRRNIVLTYGAYFTLSDGLPEAALYFQNSLIASLDAQQKHLGRAHAYAQRARILARLGDRAGALRDLEQSDAIAHALPDPAARDRHIADANVLRAELLADQDPELAVWAVGLALPYYERADRTETIARLLTLRAEMHRKAGRVHAARADLSEALQAFDRDRAALRSLSDRLHVYENQRSIFRRAVGLELDLGSELSAFAVAESAKGGPASHGSATPAAVPQGVAVVYYVVLEDRLAIWLFTNRGRSHSVVALPAAEISYWVQKIRQKIDSGTSPRELKSFQSFFQLLLDPVTKTDGAATLVFVPDGPLHELPFAALPDPRGGLLIEQRSVVVAYSMDAFLRATRRLTGLRPTTVAAFGDGHDTSVSGLPRLNVANLEAAAVGAVYEDAHVFTGQEATRRRFLTAPQPVVHFAGHATVNRAFPLHSRLWLAPDRGTERSEGSVTGAELLQHQSHARRVLVLAACEGAAGTDVAGEGLISVARLLELTGVPSVIASLWPVDDRSYPLLVDFHRELRSLADPAAALVRAQRRFLANHGPDAPIQLWGGFAAYGGVNTAARIPPHEGG